jgi:hypothetical protein
VIDQQSVERAAERFRLPEGSFERLAFRRDRKHRNQRIRAGAVGVIVALATGILLVRSLTSTSIPAYQPTPSPVTQQPSPFTERFDSPLYGLSIGYPSGWQTRAATEPWGHDEVTFGAPYVDVIFHPMLKEDLYFAVVSEPLGDKWRPGWINAGAKLESVGICKAATGGGGGRGTLDGADAWFEYCGSDLWDESVVAVETPSRGYIIYIHVGNAAAEREVNALKRQLDETLEAPFDGSWFDAALETVDLRPEDAVDSLSPSESP